VHAQQRPEAGDGPTLPGQRRAQVVAEPVEAGDLVVAPGLQRSQAGAQRDRIGRERPRRSVSRRSTST
jgi:hypothetical protein